MNKITISLSALMIFATGSWADNPCVPIAQACMELGYYKGGNTVGKGLIDDCMMPVVTNKKILADKTFEADRLVQCKSTLVAALKKYSY